MEKSGAVKPKSNAEPKSRLQRRATIQDVALEAGVSPAAVSKVLRDAYGVSAGMREKVTAAIDRLGYRPNSAARGMRGSSFTIGVVMVELSSPFQPEVAAGIAAELEATPYQEILVAPGSDPDRQQRAIEALLDRQVDGLILIAPWVSSTYLDWLASTVPTVTIARHGLPAGYDTVVDDEYDGARQIVDHLVALGHRRILHTSQNDGGLKAPSVLSHTARQEGYERAMRAHGLEPDVIVTAYTEEGGYAATVRALDRAEPPTAIFAGADIAALGAFRAIEERGLRVPDDLTLVGYDNIYISSIGRISLTTVDQSGFQTGAASARLLLERIAGRSEAVHEVFGTRLVVRSTSGPPPELRADAGTRLGTAQV